jgi:hypothetical protein
MRIFKVAALALALFVAGVPLTARALNLPQVPNLPIPPFLIPDICLALTGCPVQFTDYTLLVKLQEYRALVQNFLNIRNMAGAQGAIQQVVGIVNVANAAPPVKRGNAAAQQTITTTPDTEARIAAIDAQAQNADGAQQQAQVSNLYASSIAGNTAQTTALLAQEQAQRQAEIDGTGQALITLTGGAGAVAVADGL